MNRSVIRWVALGGFLMLGAELQAHHAVAGVYDLNNFVNPHANLKMMVPNADGTATEWTLTTASINTLTRQGINKTSIKQGEALKATVLPARNGNPAGFIRRLELSDQTFDIAIE